MYTETDTAPRADDTMAAMLVELRLLNARLDRLDRRVDALDARGRVVEELLEELGPIGREILRAASVELVAIEAKGYFTLGRELLAVLDEVVTRTRPEDVRALSRLAHETAEVVEQAGRVEPVGVMGLLRASQDEDVERGLALAIDVLRRVGRATREAPAKPRELAPPTCGTQGPKLARLAPRRDPARSAAKEARAAPRPDVADAGFVADWSPEWAARVAEAEGISLTEAHWRVLEFVRADHAKHGVSPNIRRITAGTGTPTKEIYALFPKAPGRTAARLAGVPKPAGCI